MQHDRRFQNDFAVLQETSRKSYEKEIKSSGSKVLGPLMPPTRSKLLARLLLKNEFAKILRTDRYDVVHVHTYNRGGNLLRAASDLGVPVRIVHSHNQSPALKGFTAAFRRLCAAMDRKRVLRYATDIVACSQGQADLLSASPCGITIPAVQSFIAASTLMSFDRRQAGFLPELISGISTAFRKTRLS